ncbi:uncharacterized protein [Argopecten irradians]|uniref:uncharacterized protein isoform X2 n=1 Tax=Argopecten irradians TaxID=31199 RepID=UPI00371D18E2
MAEFTLWTLLCFFIAVTFSTGEASLKVTLTANVTHGLQSSVISFYGTPVILQGIVFQCNISSDEDLTDYLYDIQWFINDNSIVTHRNIPYTNLTQTGLHQSEWTDTYTLGFLTDLPEYTVPENGSINITIRLTVPIDYIYPENLPPVLMDSFMRDHYISLRLRSPYNYNDIKDEYECAYGGANNEQISFVDTRCSLRFDIYKWNAPTNITIYGLVDGIAAPISSRTSYIRLTTDIPVYSPAFSQVTIPDIKVTVLDENIKLSGRTCSIPTGPFINTFDGRQVRFLQYGEFVVFIHNALPIRIHAVFDRCWHAGQGSCTCGIAIRNMDAVFVLNFCKENIGAQWQHLSNVNRYVELKVNGNDGMEIEYRSSTYKVTLPSGTVITIGVHIDESHAHINAVVIKPSVADWKTTSGMCGFLDGNPDNDIRLRSGEISEGFGISWRRNITLDGSSLFVSDIILMDMPLKPVQYCSCPEDDYRYPYIYPVAQCNMNPNTAVCPKLTNVESQGQQYDKYRAKKALGYLHRDSNTTEDDIEVSIHDVIMDEKYQNNSQNITWTNDWNESLAEESLSGHTLDSDSMLIKCKDAVSGMDDVITNGINECIVNIMIFGQTWYMEGTLKALQEHCLAEAEYLVTHESHGVSKAVLDE